MQWKNVLVEMLEIIPIFFFIPFHWRFNDENMQTQSIIWES